MGSSAKKAAQRRGGGSAAQIAADRGASKGPAPVEGMDVGHKVAWVCLNLLLIAVPLAMSNLTWTGIWVLPFTFDQFDIVKVFFTRGLTLVAYAGLGWSLLTRGGKVRRSPVDWLVVAFLAWVVVTTVLSVHPATAVFGKYRRFEGLISLFNYAAVFFLAVQFVDRPSRIRALVRTTFVGGVLVSAYGAMQVLGIDIINWGNALPFEARRAFSTFGNPDLLGGYLVLMLPLGVALALAEEDSWWRAAYWSGFLVVTYTWINAFVRGSWIGGAVALVIIAFAVLRRREKVRAVDGAFMGLVVLVGAIAVLRSLSAESEVMNVVLRLRSILDFSTGSGETRTQIWEAAVAAVRDRPIFGFGADTFRLLFPKYKPVEYVASAGYLSVADNVHSYPLQIATALGIPGALLLYGVFGVAAWRSASTAFSRDAAGERLLLAGLWAGCAGYVVNLMGGLSVTGSSVVLWLFMGILVAPMAGSVAFKAPSWGVYAATALVIVAGAASIANVVYISADSYYLKARMSSGQAAVDAASKAVKLNRFNDMYRAEIGLAYQDLFLADLGSMRQAQSSGQDARQYAEAAVSSLQSSEAAMRETIEYVPWEYDNYVFLANLCNVAADFGMGDEWRQKAADVAEKGVKVERYGPAIRLQLAIAYNGLGRADEALKQAERAVEMDVRYVDGNMFVGDAYKRRGRNTEAAQAYRRVLRREPGNRTASNSLSEVETSKDATSAQ